MVKKQKNNCYFFLKQSCGLCSFGLFYIQDFIYHSHYMKDLSVHMAWGLVFVNTRRTEDLCSIKEGGGKEKCKFFATH